MKINKFFKFKDNKLLLISILSFGSVAGALVSQYVYDMQPCSWCILQRIVFIVIGIVSLIFYINSKMKIIGFGLVSIFSSLGIMVAMYQFFVASKNFDCNISIAEKIIVATGLNNIPELFGIYALCADLSPLIFGIPYVLWSCIMFLGIMIISDICVFNTVKLNRVIEK
ncbi:disulfide bond formation protein B [archaeon]|nr:disulfide bond formation protein B [archaeon]NCQ50453.1 disulfide bond formation protein B [archaeon]